MKSKSFQKYLAKRLSQEEIDEIEKEAQREINSFQGIPLKSLQIKKIA